MKKFREEINNIFKPLKKKQALTMLFSAGVIAFRFLLLIEIQELVDSISQENFDITMGHIKKCLVFIVIFFAANCIFQYFFRTLMYTSHYALIKSFFGDSLKKEYAFHEKYTSSVALSMIKDDSKFISDWKSFGLITLIFNVVTLVAAFGIMLRYNILITVIILGCVVLCFVLTHFISNVIGTKTYNLQMANSNMNQKIIDYLNGIKDIKQYKKEGFFKKRLADYIDGTTYKYSRSLSAYYSIFVSIYAVLTIALPILVILIGSIMILNGQFTIGQLMATYALVGVLQEPVLNIPEYINQRRQALAMQDKIMPILEKEKQDYSTDHLAPLQTFSFHSDAYTFQDGKSILEHVDFELERGGHLILRGESGRGKSSLINIISGFYSIKGQPVQMQYNGIPVENIQPQAYYDHVLQAPQMPYIFRDTVLNNITLGESYSEDAIREVIQMSGLTEFVKSKGMDYLLEQNGENISGGQKQRVGLARVLLRKPDLLMLDEPTSALDAELVSTVTENVVSYCERYGIALILISHNDSFERYYEMIQPGNKGEIFV